MSGHVEGATALILASARAMLSAGQVHLTVSVKEGPAPGTWRYTLSDTREIRIEHGRVAGIARIMDVLVYAAGICKDAYQPETTERRLLEQFASQAQDQA